MVCEKHKSQLVSENSREAWCVWLKRGNFFFLHFTEAYIIFLLSVKQCLLYRILGVGDGKKKKSKIKKNPESQKQKTSGPERDNVDTPPHRRHLVEMQVFRQSGPLKQRPNGSLAESRARGSGFLRTNGISEMFCWGFF